jgi:hypothetical protein
MTICRFSSPHIAAQSSAHNYYIQRVAEFAAELSKKGQVSGTPPIIAEVFCFQMISTQTYSIEIGR